MRQHVILRPMRAKWIILLTIFINCTFILLFNIRAQAEGGIAISGSFNEHHYKIVPGETISAQDINIVVYNNNNTALKVKFAAEAPKGVTLDLNGKMIIIPARSSNSFPVSISVSKLVVPGEYEIGVSAEPLPDEKSGISVLGAAQLRTKLSVFGEAGRIEINTLTPEGEAFVDGEIHLFAKEENKLTSISTKRGSKMEERVVPGEYLAKVLYQGNEVGQSIFTLKKDEIKKITIKAKLIFIQGFAVTPQYNGASKEIVSARVTYTLKNIYKPINAAKVVLKVYHKDPSNIFSRLWSSKLNFIFQHANAYSDKNLTDNDLLEEVEMATFPTLEIGSQSGRYIYAPVNQWEKGVYNFAINLYGINGLSLSKESVIYGESEGVEIVIEGSNVILYLTLILIVSLIIGGIIFLVTRKKEWLKKKLHKES